MFYILDDCSILSKMSIFFVRAGCKIQLASYDPKHASQSLSDKPFVHSYTLNRKTTGHIWTLCIRNECSTIRHSLCALESYMRDPTGELWPHTHTSHALIQHCVHILQARIYIAFWCANMHDDKTHVPYYCILHTKRQLHCQRCIVL